MIDLSRHHHPTRIHYSFKFNYAIVKETSLFINSNLYEKNIIIILSTHTHGPALTVLRNKINTT